MTLYARAITLRNCGRFTMIASDFGGDYRTQTHVTSQALYASLTRGASWRAGGTIDGHPVYPAIRVRKDRYDFAADYDLETLPLWFTPGLFARRNGEDLSDQALDAGYFNVVHECYPSTSQQFKFDKKGQVKSTSRPSRVPTYGTWQGILPDRRLQTIALAHDPALLEGFEAGQTYLLGKKRTMMQITSLSEVTPGEEKRGTCKTGLLQMPPDKIMHFHSFDVVAATMRYLIVHGETRDEQTYVVFDLQNIHNTQLLALSQFYLESTPLAKEMQQ
jgi:hypothetical protein